MRLLFDEMVELKENEISASINLSSMHRLISPYYLSFHQYIFHQDKQAYSFRNNNAINVIIQRHLMKSMNQPTYIHRVNHDEQDLQMEGEWDYQLLHEHKIGQMSPVCLKLMENKCSEV